MKRFILFSALSLCACNLSLAASAPAQKAVENIKGVLEMFQEKSRCPSPSVNQSSSSPQAAAAQPSILSTPSQEDIARARIKEILLKKRQPLLLSVQTELENLNAQAEKGHLASVQALEDLKFLMNGSYLCGLTSNTESAILLRKAGFTFTDRDRVRSSPADFIRQDVQKLLNSIK